MIISAVARKIPKILFVFNMLLTGLGAWALFEVVSFWVPSQDGGREPAVNPGSQVSSKQGVRVASKSLKDHELLSVPDFGDGR